jgi:NADH-quinone oxidoreductase subunit L
MFFLEHIWVIPLLPMLGAAMMFFFGRRLSKRAVNAFCVGAVVVAFAWSCLAVWQYTHTWTAEHPGQPYQKILYTWIGSDTMVPGVGHAGRPIQFNADAGFLLDPLSSIWLLFVTGVGMLIHIYSIGYMAHEGGYYRFFGYLNLFMFSMLTLILGNNYAVLFVGWEGVGLCSYLLIGFYFHKHSASTAANKAFIVNRIGDAMFLMGLFLMVWYFGSVRFFDPVGTSVPASVFGIARSGDYLVGDKFITAICLLLFGGACGKSAQFPLYVWLPDAMEGPTPVSALIHAATMVTAGVYMVARSNALFVLAPEAMKVVAIVGGVTALFAATIGLVQNDIKRVLAYSTVSQLGYMFMALGLGAFAAGVFHVFTHAFFKALLFLGAGSVIHAVSGEQDMRHMGALHNKIPVTYRTMLIGTLAIVGFPPLAGFFSKDEILWQAYSSHNGGFRALWVVGFIAALCTAFYMFRLMTLTFWGRSRVSHEAEHHLHESPKSMTGPLVVLALASVFAGFLGVPKSLWGTNAFEHFLEPVFENRMVTGAAAGHVGSTAVERTAEAAPKPEGKEEKGEAIEYILMGLSISLVPIGFVLAWRAYCKAERDCREPINVLAPPVYRALLNKYYVDELYDYTITGRRKIGPFRLGAMGLGTAMWKFDANVIDGTVNGAGWTTRMFGKLSNAWDRYIIDGLLVNGPAYFTKLMSYPARALQWGLVQWYALVMVGGLVGFIWYYAVR